MCSLLPWLKMNQPLCLLAVFEAGSSKSWGVERSQAKPTAPHAPSPSPSPSSLSNAKHIRIPLPHPSSFLRIISPCPFVLCLLTAVCQFVNGFVCSCACLNTKMTQQGGYCMTGDYTMERVYLSQGMALHCLLNALPDKEGKRWWGVRWFWRAALARIFTWQDYWHTVTHIVSSACSVAGTASRPVLIMLTMAWVCVIWLKGESRTGDVFNVL